MNAPALPDTLSGLLRVAVRDARLVQKDPAYRLDMGTWHSPTGNERCSVCLAGAVMAKTLERPADENAVPCDFDGVLAQKLRLIDDMRCGSVMRAHCLLTGLSVHSFAPEVVETLVKASAVICAGYTAKTGRAPWRAYERAARILERGGL
jgi:hypothetical protein